MHQDSSSGWGDAGEQKRNRNVTELSCFFCANSIIIERD